MARIRIVDEWLRSPASPPTYYRSIMVVAERWAEQRVLMRAYAESADQTRPTIVLHGTELAIGPASIDPNDSWGIHVAPPIDGRAQELQAQLELAAKRMSGSKHNPPRLEDEGGNFDRKRTNNWAPGSPKDVPDAPIPRSGWDPAVAASQHLQAASSAYLPVAPGAATVLPGQMSAVAVPSLQSAAYVPAAPAAEVIPRGGNADSSVRLKRATGTPRGARTALGYSSGAGAQSVVIRLGLRPAAASRLGRLADRTVPADFEISSVEREILNLLAERERLTARAIRELVGVVDAVAWMEAFMAKLEGYGIDLIAPGDAAGSEPTYVLRG
jgi:hypothetical protein